MPYQCVADAVNSGIMDYDNAMRYMLPIMIPGPDVITFTYDVSEKDDPGTGMFVLCSECGGGEVEGVIHHYPGCPESKLDN